MSLSGTGTKLSAAVMAAFLLVFPILPAASQEQPPATTGPAAVEVGEERDGAELEAIVSAAREQKPGSVAAFCRFLRARGGAGSLPVHDLPDTVRDTLTQLLSLAAPVNEAVDLAATFLGDPDNDAGRFRTLLTAVLADGMPDNELTIEAVQLILNARATGKELVRRRESIFAQLGAEARQGTIHDGIRLAWSLIRVGAARSDTAIDAESFFHDETSARMRLRHMGAYINADLQAGDHRNQVRAEVDGYRFRTGWAVLLQKPFGWMAAMSRSMREAGIAPDLHPEWTIMEGPEGLVALAYPVTEGWDGIPVAAFFQGAVRTVRPLPAPAGAARMKDAFLQAARRLCDGIMADEEIPFPLRQALKPVLMGTYSEVDPRDYFDNEFCRRLIEADYLEAHVPVLGPERLRELQEYREALARLEAGIDLFAVDLGQAGSLVAVSRPDVDLAVGEGPGYADKETGESLYRHQWRWERDDATLFHSPLPSRYLYAMSVLERYEGRHRTRPQGVPAVTEVWHAVLGRLAAYRMGDAAATGDAEKWLEAVVLDARGRRDASGGPLGWNFPLFVPVRDDQGDPVLIATLNGVVESPDFSRVPADEKRRAQDEWLDTTARVFSTPGELNLIFTQFFRYCSDSPLPEVPGLIGSHYGLSDTHQTVYESLERRWVGRLIGDCDDLAEFFQELLERQGKLCHVMQLPSHAAAGFLQENAEGKYEFVVLQTGPVLLFTDSTREGAVEQAYRHFQEPGRGHFTLSAVPLLLRFADEDTRTAFVLSARIYWDRDYADAMIAVQRYWHLHTFAAGVGAMEKMIESDREAGNVRELASLYERTKQYDLAKALRLEELSRIGTDEPLARMTALVELAQLLHEADESDAALRALLEMEPLLDSLPQTGAEWMRSAWSGLMARVGRPVHAWERIGAEAARAWDGGGQPSEAFLRSVVYLYERLAGDERAEALAAREAMAAFLERAFSQGYFQSDDGYNKIHSRYHLLGRYAVFSQGLETGLARLLSDGPYPDAPRDHERTEPGVTPDDWAWFRATPRLFVSLAFDMLEREEFPERYNPALAERCLERVASAVDNAVRLGSNAAAGSELLARTDIALAILRNDLQAFTQAMEKVRERNYANLYNVAATTFGHLSGLLPREDLPRWLEVFHRFLPGRQHYFKAAYTALEKGHAGHAIRIGRAAAEFFPDEPLFAAEAEALEDAAKRMGERRVPADEAMGESGQASCVPIIRVRTAA